jgi:pimeloyl-[acyl-carrier protein] synthase
VHPSHTSSSAALDFNLADPVQLHDDFFLPAVDRLRDTEPVFWSNYQQGWMVTSHELVWKGFREPLLSAKRLQLNQLSSIDEDEQDNLVPNLKRSINSWIINVDGQTHVRLRHLVMRAFSREVVEAFTPQIEVTVARLLLEVQGKESFDFIGEVAFRLPAIIIMRLLGLSERHQNDLRRWAYEVSGALATEAPPKNTLLTAERAFVEMNEAFSEGFAERRRNRTADLMTHLVSAREHSDAMSEDELLALCQIILIAGNGTTANSLGLGLPAGLPPF